MSKWPIRNAAPKHRWPWYIYRCIELRFSKPHGWGAGSIMFCHMTRARSRRLNHRISNSYKFEKAHEKCNSFANLQL
jgi:hypothetical protein